MFMATLKHVRFFQNPAAAPRYVEDAIAYAALFERRPLMPGGNPK